MNRAETLDAARKAVLTDRAETHGAPENSFALIADLWSALLAQDISPAQVCLMLAVLKVARGWDNPAHDDNWVDLAGYAACGAEVAGDGPAPAAVARQANVMTIEEWDAETLRETRRAAALNAGLVMAPAEIDRRMEGVNARIAAQEPAPAQPAGGNEGVARSAVNWPAIGAVARGEMTPDEWLNGAAKAVSPEDARRFLASLEAQVASAGLQGAPVVAFNWQRPAPAQPAGGNEGGERAAQTAPAPEAVPTPAVQDRQGPPPSDPSVKAPWTGKRPRVRGKDGNWTGGWTEDEDALAVELAAKGHSNAMIGRALQRAPNNVGATLGARLALRIAEAKAAMAAQIETGAGAVVPSTPAPASSTPGAVVAAAEPAGPPPAVAPGETDALSAAGAARRIAKALRDPAALEYWKITGLLEWVALIDDARAVQSWTLENDRELLGLIGQQWTPGDIANLTERSLDELKTRKAQLTCAGRWPLAEVAAALGVEA